MPAKDTETEKDGALSISGPGGWRATAQGRDTITVLLVGVLIALGYLHHQSNDQRAQDAAAQHQRIEEKFSEMIYVISLPQDARERLNISMPDSLRSKMRRNRRDEQ